MAAEPVAGVVSDGEMDSETQVKRHLIESYFSTNTTMEVEELCALLSSSVIAIYPSATLRGKERYKQHVTKTFKSAKKFLSFNKVSPTKIVIERDKAIARWTFEYQFCCTHSRFDGYNEYEFIQEDGKWLISLVRTETIEAKPWYLRLSVCCKRNCFCCCYTKDELADL